jgi:Uma2 family endonuclease
MNAPVFPDRLRRLFTTADIFAMIEAGVIGPDEKFELIDGEIVLMSPKNSPHEHYKSRLVRWLNRILPDTLNVGIEQTIYLEPRTFLDPDIVVAPGHIRSADLKGPSALLVIEVSDTTLNTDLGVKARKYATAGVPHYWVIDVNTPCILAHARPGARGYAKPRKIAANAPIALPFMKQAKLVLDEVAPPLR